MIADMVEIVLDVGVFEVEARDAVRAAASDYRQGTANFADYLIAHVNRRDGCDSTVTLDRAAAGSRLFELLET